MASDSFSSEISLEVSADACTVVADSVVGDVPLPGKLPDALCSRAKAKAIAGFDLDDAKVIPNKYASRVTPYPFTKVHGNASCCVDLSKRAKRRMRRRAARSSQATGISVS